MKSPPRPHRREPGVTQWLLLGGALCALCLAFRTGDAAAAARPGEQGEARGVSAWKHPAAPAHAALELSRPEQAPPPGDKRCDAWQGLVVGPERGPLFAGGSPRVHGPRVSRGHRADRPLVANCPARGPPEPREVPSR